MKLLCPILAKQHQLLRTATRATDTASGQLLSSECLILLRIDVNAVLIAAESLSFAMDF